jgi:hypothetical protein
MSRAELHHIKHLRFLGAERFIIGLLLMWFFSPRMMRPATDPLDVLVDAVG